MICRMLAQHAQENVPRFNVCLPQKHTKQQTQRYVRAALTLIARIAAARRELCSLCKTNCKSAAAKRSVEKLLGSSLPSVELLAKFRLRASQAIEPKLSYTIELRQSNNNFAVLLSDWHTLRSIDYSGRTTFTLFDTKLNHLAMPTDPQTARKLRKWTDVHACARVTYGNV